MTYFNVIRKVNGYVAVVFSRSEAHNTLDAEFIAELTRAFESLASDRTVRLICLMASGDSFCAGADLKWMKAAAAQGEAENHTDALALAGLFEAIDRCPKPVVAIVKGAALGGGVGIIACCDLVFASPSAKFGLTEVRLGLIPATISPYVIAKIGVSHARRFMLTGERFSADIAQRIGLVHEIADDPAEAALPSIDALLHQCGPEAVADTKRLIANVAGKPITAELLDMTASRIAVRRASDEGREGMAAFLNKRKPNWVDERKDGDVQ